MAAELTLRVKGKNLSVQEVQGAVLKNTQLADGYVSDEGRL